MFRSRRWLPWALAAAVLAPAVAGSAQGRTHVVRAGQTLSEIARRYHVSVEAIQRANRLRGTTVHPGDRLRIPRRARSRRTRGRRYRVRAGDTLADIARRFRVSVRALRIANRLRSATIHPGDVLHVPRPGQSGAQLRAALRRGNPPPDPDAEAPIDDEVREAAEARAEELGVGPTHVAQRLLREAPEPAWVEAAAGDAPLEGTLRMPVDEGRYLRGWGSGRGGYHLAIDIGAPSGTAVHAAERGLVAYAGRGVRGYGNFVILVHPNGWVTAYAHHRRNLVVPGQLVERGDPVGRVGQTGFARGPHLHFILVHDGRHCDAVPLFRPRIQRANGQEVDEPEVVWDTDHRPSAVRCLARSQRPHPHYRRRHRRRRR
ncbi:MAG TPA: LysM peptidoglycan-binding domain-containing protein [Sandaracinaceae bacterium LLY-WYZ-13_1]|nr:LysM peptidoglycan-binding domain-containing protein [Sandaracinaceae bacterium LLY-WYZ-13_1]